MPLRIPSIPLGQMNAREQATYLSQAGIQASTSSDSFTPSSWTGFSSDPSGDLYYIDFGSIVFIWVSGALTGTSDDTGMSHGGLPESIWPSVNRLVRCYVINGGYTLGGAAEVTTTGLIQYYIEDTTGGGAGTADDNKVVPQATGFANTGTKGLPAGFIIFYAK